MDKYRCSVLAFSTHSNSWSTYFKPHGYRLGFYIAVFLFRLYVLYIAANRLENSIQSERFGSCWYRELTRSKRCKDGFDFSDHVCLFYANYAIPIAVELCYAHCFVSPSANTSTSQSPSWNFVSFIVTNYSICGSCVARRPTAFFLSVVLHRGQTLCLRETVCAAS